MQLLSFIRQEPLTDTETGFPFGMFLCRRNGPPHAPKQEANSVADHDSPKREGRNGRPFTLPFEIGPKPGRSSGFPLKSPFSASPIRYDRTGGYDIDASGTASKVLLSFLGMSSPIEHEPVCGPSEMPVQAVPVGFGRERRSKSICDAFEASTRFQETGNAFWNVSIRPSGRNGKAGSHMCLPVFLHAFLPKTGNSIFEGSS